ncbi:hypothetical protein, partial [Novipirellula rosea]|uniref:hypothetical protein n=1 Tax=Novipirellula rosea TaxID=1031540 RepID=UPI0031F00DB9
ATGCAPKPVIHPAVLKLEFDAAIPHARDDVTGVTHLTLRGRQIGTDAHRLIERCTNLRVLSIRACSADQSPMLAIAPTVQQLYVSNLKSRVPVTLTGGESLGMLVITSCELDKYNLDRLRSNDTLTQLTVVDCTVSDETISWIHNQNALTTLQYGNNDASSDLFVNWASTNLTHVDIAGMIPSPDAVAFLERQPSLSHFSIDLCGDPIAGAAVAILQRKSLGSAHLFCARKDLPRYNQLSSNAIPIVRVYQRHNDLSRTKYTDEP